MVDPLPDLHPGDLHGGRVLHQVVDGHGTGPADPGGQVLQADRDIGADPVQGDLAPGAGHVRQLGPSHCDVLPLLVQLVRPVPQHRVEGVQTGLDQRGVGDPGAVETGIGLPRLVGRGLLQCGGRCVRVGLAGHEGRHPADGVGAAGMTGLDQEVGVRGHERRGHGHLAPVGQQVVGRVGEVLDHGEDVVPTTRVESRRVVAQFVQDLLHLEGRRGGLDQAGGADAPVRDLQPVLGVCEHVVPQPGLAVGLHLG